MEDTNQTTQNNSPITPSKLLIFAVFIVGVCIGLLIATALIPEQPDKVYIPVTPEQTRQTLPPLEA